MVGNCDFPTPATNVATTTKQMQVTFKGQVEDMWTLEWPTCTQWLMFLKTTLFQFQNQQQSCSLLHLTLNYIAIESKSQRLGEYIETRKMRVALAFLLNFIDFIYPWLRKKMMYYCLPGACVKSGVEIAIETWPVSPPAVVEPGMGPWNLTLYSSPRLSL